MNEVLPAFLSDKPEPTTYQKGFLDGFRAGQEAITKEYMAKLRRVLGEELVKQIGERRE